MIMKMVMSEKVQQRVRTSTTSTDIVCRIAQTYDAFIVVVFIWSRYVSISDAVLCVLTRPGNIHAKILCSGCIYVCI
jgi:hypothetical protein